MASKDLARALAAVTAACGKSHGDNMGGEACCPECAAGLPCACEEADNAELDEVRDPYDWLEEMEERYEEMGVSRAQAAIEQAMAALSGSDVSLEDYLDRRAAIYQMEGANEGVDYIDEIEDNREELEEQEEALSASVAKVEQLITALRMPDSPPEALRLVLKAVSKAQTLAKAGRFEDAQEALEEAVGLAEAILQEDMLREAAQIREGMEREGYARSYAKALRSNYTSAGRPATKGNISLWNAAEADEMLGNAYRTLHTIKFDMDQFDEIPPYLQRFYKEVMDAARAVGKARDHTNTVRELAKRIGRQVLRGSSTETKVKAVQSYGVRMSQALGSIRDLGRYFKDLHQSAQNIAREDPHGYSPEVEALEETVFDIERTLSSIKDYMRGF